MTSSRALLHRLRLAVAVLFWPALGLVIWGSLINFDDFPIDIDVDHSDLILHFIAYGGLAGMAAFASRERQTALVGLVGLILLGAVLELAQSLTTREASLFDGLANLAGVVSGGVLARAIVEPLRRRYAREPEGRGPRK